MRYSILFVAFFGTGILSACSVHNPQTADELRMTEAGFMKSFESFTVKRPYKAVKSSLIKQSKKCLNIKASNYETINHNRGAVSSQWVYHPRIESTKRGVSLILQKDLVGGNMVMMGEVPTGGNYTFVLDAYPKTSKSTQIDFHYVEGYMGENEYDAVIAWVKAGAKACPAR